ncbi:GNAT family N-acetyltransferase [uncultured Shewanella sp.]|uniref:GNAT family N-acetyltransferase n=1 Tax=uncultured Shewanella sp. TaxID=173975 RepID=UPI00262FFCB9|nr:GNAT family N-acetyltransferase [uncultured Shewanella sp.]
MLLFRQAERKDIDCLVQMLFDDPLGRLREDSQMPLNPQYLSAFEAIIKDDNNELIIVEDKGDVLGMLQLTFIPYLTHIGSWRCLIEGVRVHKAHRGKGLGTLFFEWAIERAKQRKCNMVQLTSNKSRVDALRFYESLGFQASHEGFKLSL